MVGTEGSGLTEVSPIEKVGVAEGSRAASKCVHLLKVVPPAPIPACLVGSEMCIRDRRRTDRQSEVTL